jgi:hypothetical protein
MPDYFSGISFADYAARLDIFIPFRDISSHLPFAFHDFRHSD